MCIGRGPAWEVDDHGFKSNEIIARRQSNKAQSLWEDNGSLDISGDPCLLLSCPIEPLSDPVTLQKPALLLGPCHNMPCLFDDAACHASLGCHCHKSNAGSAKVSMSRKCHS